MMHSKKINLSFKVYHSLTFQPEETQNFAHQYITEYDQLKQTLEDNRCNIIKAHMLSGKTTAIR